MIYVAFTVALLAFLMMVTEIERWPSRFMNYLKEYHRYHA
jgi:hypothetical protein